jgi:hypothetical protein
MHELVTLPGKCPICGRGPLKPLPIKYSVYVSKPEQPEPVGGLLGYQCTQGLHLFFVMARDVEEVEELGRA